MEETSGEQRTFRIEVIVIQQTICQIEQSGFRTSCRPGRQNKPAEVCSQAGNACPLSALMMDLGSRPISERQFPAHMGTTLHYDHINKYLEFQRVESLKAVRRFSQYRSLLMHSGAHACCRLAESTLMLGLEDDLTRDFRYHKSANEN